MNAGKTDHTARTTTPRSAARTAVAMPTIAMKTGSSTPCEMSGASSMVPAETRQARRPEDHRWASAIPASDSPPTNMYAAGIGIHW